MRHHHAPQPTHTVHAAHLAAIALLTLAASAAAQTSAVFIPLNKISPDNDISVEPWGVSADGSVVVGASGTHAFRWTRADGMLPIGAFVNPGGSQLSIAYDVSADGSVIVGGSVVPDSDIGFGTPFRWTIATGLVRLGQLDPSIPTGAATGVSADGSIIVGYSVSPNSTEFFGTEAFRWTSSTGMVGLGDLAGGPLQSRALDVSRDGASILGSGSLVVPSDHSALWFANQVSDLGSITQTDLFHISADGQTFVGRAASRGLVINDGIRFEISQLDFILGDTSYISGISGNGALAGGSMNINAQTARGAGRAYIWDQASGARLLQPLLTTTFGLDLTGWELNTVIAISDDGSTLIGRGFSPGGDQLGWVVIFSDGTLGACCLPTGACGVGERTACAGRWTAGATCSPGSCTPTPALTGICCDPSAACTITTRAACAGLWSLGGVCDPLPCQAQDPTGSCCFTFSTDCTTTTEAECSFGTWTAGQACDPTPCTGPTGSCCIGSACTVTPRTACSGTWQFFGVCDPNPCCPADFNGSGDITVQDIFDFLAAYFTTDPRADFNGSGSVTVQDIFDFLAAYFAGC
jgi:probable HAF family extracellular repeat protein